MVIPQHTDGDGFHQSLLVIPDSGGQRPVRSMPLRTRHPFKDETPHYATQSTLTKTTVYEMLDKEEHEVLYMHENPDVHDVQMKFEQGDIPAKDKHIYPEGNTSLGATKYIN